MEQIIKKALEGGYPRGRIGSQYRFVMDSDLWKALGKACGWTEICDNPDHGFINAMGFHDIGRLGCPGCGHNDDHVIESSRYNWRKYALRFHEINLTQGWDKAVEYLEDLIKE